MGLLKKNNYLTLYQQRITKQKIIFCLVGGSAASIHLLLVIWLVAKKCFQPEWANVVAFIVASQCSYWGHRYWTFKAQGKSIQKTMIRFFVLALMAFILNEGLFITLVQKLCLPYPIAAILVLAIVPILCFYLNKFWVFN